MTCEVCLLKENGTFNCSDQTLFSVCLDSRCFSRSLARFQVERSMGEKVTPKWWIDNMGGVSRQPGGNDCPFVCVLSRDITTAIGAPCLPLRRSIVFSLLHPFKVLPIRRLGVMPQLFTKTTHTKRQHCGVLWLIAWITRSGASVWTDREKQM